MVKSIDNIICINKNIFNKILLLTNNTSDLCLDENDDSYLISKTVFDKTVDRFNKLLMEKQHESFKNIKGASLSRYNELNDEYERIKYNYIRNNFNKVKNSKINTESLLDISIKIYEEIENIKKVPLYINDIRKELKEIQNNESKSIINSYMIRFKRLLNDGGLIEYYINLKAELDSALRKEYINEINSFFGDNKSMYLVKNEGQVKILDVSNLNGFTYGLIYSSESIKKVTNKNSDSFISFYNCNFESCNIELNDDKPIGIYCVTYGEHSINPNYKAAKNIFVQKNTPFVEFDKTLLMSRSDYSINELINNLLVDSNLDVVANSNKEQSYYDLYEPFFEQFKNLKFGDYNESQIINIFDAHRHYINDQRYLDLDNLLSKSLDDSEIINILNINIYFDFNIFRKGNINRTKLKLFHDTFYDKKDDERLNRIYPGIDVILNEIHEASCNRIDEIIEIINKAPCKDSWLIKNLIKPIHIVKKNQTNNIQSTESTFVSSGNEKTIYKEFVDFLKSADEDIVRSRA